ncbi:MAG TPA: hypothetical protein VFS21_33850 [Roseiflexaceae bacterium]|nr:hypothetical protein [Roseiflexaceae bacterium]
MTPSAFDRRIGDRVLCNWSKDTFWYPATIRQIEAQGIYVVFDDSDEEWTLAAQIADLDVPVGTRVQCRWKGEKYFYRGTVAQSEGERILVAYDDGDEEWTTVGMIRIGSAVLGRWKLDDRVLCKWSRDHCWYPATIRDLSGQRVFVGFDDGDQEWTTSGLLFDLDVPVGMRVQCYRPSIQQFSTGRVARKEGAEIVVEYDDGTTEDSNLSRIRIHPEIPQESASAQRLVQSLLSAEAGGEEGQTGADGPGGYKQG